MKRLMLILAVSAFAAEASVTLDGTVLKADVAGGVEETYSVIGSAVTGLIKTGSGTLVVDQANASFKGNVEIREGAIRTTVKNAIGTDNTITVSSGAELVAAITANLYRDSAFEGCTIKIAGAGMNGKGAFRYEGEHDAPALVRGGFVLTAPASVGGNNYWGIGYDGEIDLGGHTLTNLSSDLFVLYGVKIKDGPGDIVESGYKVSLQNAPWNRNLTFNGGPDNSFIVDGSTLQFYYGVDSSINLKEAPTAVIPWTLRPRNGAKVEMLSGREAQWNGPVIGDGTVLSVYLTEGKIFSFKGPMSGIGSFDVTPSGVFRLSDAGDVYIENTTDSVKQTGKVYSTLDREPVLMEVLGDTVFRCTMPVTGMGTTKPSPGYSEFYVGNEQTSWTAASGAHSNRWGKLRVADGAVVTNNIHVGSRGMGAVYQKDSAVYIPSGDGSYGYVGYGYGSYGYWGLTNSTLTVYGYAFLGRNVGSTGMLVQHGGDVTVERGPYFYVSAGGDSVVYVDRGGRFGVNNQLNLGYYTGNGGADGSAQVTVDGDGSVVSTGAVYWRKRNNFRTYLNLNNGGALEAGFLYRGTTGDDSTSKAYLSFDGGVWRFPDTGSYRYAYYANSQVHAPHHAVVYAGGATFDVQGGDTTVCVTAPLEKPEGLSVTAIEMPSDPDFADTTHLGALRVEIEGAGEGASAFVDFDDEAGVPTEIIVTSPGFGYTEGTTAARVVSMNGAKKWDCGTVTLNRITGGGIRKTGEGTLVLKAANTYAGATTVSGGTLEISSGSAIPSGQPLVMAGGILDMDAYSLTVSDLSGHGTITADDGVALTVTGKFSADAAGLVAGRTLAVTIPVAFGDETHVDIADLDDLDRNRVYTLLSAPSGITGAFATENERWDARLSADGKKLRLRYRKGLALSVR